MKKINVAELLKDCPKGMELDCTMYDNLYFDSLNADYYGTINCYTLIDGIKTSINFTKYGTFNNHTGAKCVIFPKGKTTWDGFVPPCEFKDGDILSYQCAGLRNRSIYIYRHHHTMNTSYYVALGCDLDFMVSRKEGCALSGYNITARLATEKEKQKLFDAIKANGYKWNAETKTLEKLIEPKFKIEKGKWYVCIKDLLDNYANKAFCKGNTYLSTQDGSLIPSNSNVPFEVVCASTYFRELTKFKVGDKVRHKCPEFRGERIIANCNDTGYFTTINDWIDIAHQDDWELVSEKLVEPKFKVGDRIVHKKEGNPFTITEITDGCYKGGTRYAILITQQDNFELTHNKFDINTLVPFESKVLIRDTKS